MEIPEHIRKLVKEYKAGKIKVEDVELTEHESDVAKDEFVFTLPTYTRLGEADGTHEFKLTIESLVSTKLSLQIALDKVLEEADSFFTDYDELIQVLQDIKNKKK